MRGQESAAYRRTRTSDLVRVKQCRSKTGVDWSAIFEEFWTSRDCRGPRSLQNRHRNKLAGDGLRSLTTTSKVTRPIRCCVLSHALDHLRLTRGDVEEHQGWAIWPSTIRLPRLNEFGAHVQIAREHRLRGVERRSHALDGTAVPGSTSPASGFSSSSSCTAEIRFVKTVVSTKVRNSSISTTVKHTTG